MCASPSTFPNAAGEAVHGSLPFISQQMLLELLLHVKFRHAQRRLDPALATRCQGKHPRPLPPGIKTLGGCKIDTP